MRLGECCGAAQGEVAADGAACADGGEAEEAELLAEAVAAGVHPESIAVDPGPDFTKTPAQTVEVLRHLSELNPDGLPMLLAISRKDFIGALTQTRPKERGAGTLAAVAAVGSGTGTILRLHDVAEARRFLTVLDVLRSDEPVDPELRLADELRWAAGRPDGTKAT